MKIIVGIGTEEGQKFGNRGLCDEILIEPIRQRFLRDQLFKQEWSVRRIGRGRGYVPGLWGWRWPKCSALWASLIGTSSSQRDPGLLLWESSKPTETHETCNHQIILSIGGADIYRSQGYVSKRLSSCAASSNADQQTLGFRIASNR